MAKERKCKKCGLSYKGFNTTCPFCHRTTKFGVFNKIMTIIGYITTVIATCFLIYAGIIYLTVISFSIVPLLMFIGFIAIIVGLIIMIFK